MALRSPIGLCFDVCQPVRLIDEMLEEIMRFRLNDILASFLGRPADSQTQHQLETVANNLLYTVKSQFGIDDRMTDIDKILVNIDPVDPHRYSFSIVRKNRYPEIL